MEIEVELAEQDHIAFYRAYGLKRNWALKILVLLVIDLIICLYINKRVAALFGQMIIIGIILFPILFLLPYLLTKRKFKKWNDDNPFHYQEKHSDPLRRVLKSLMKGKKSF